MILWNPFKSRFQKTCNHYKNNTRTSSVRSITFFLHGCLGHGNRYPIHTLVHIKSPKVTNVISWPISSMMWRQKSCLDQSAACKATSRNQDQAVLITLGCFWYYYRCNNYVARRKNFTKRKLWHHSFQGLWFVQMAYVYAKFRAWCHSFQPFRSQHLCLVVFCLLFSMIVACNNWMKNLMLYTNS